MADMVATAAAPVKTVPEPVRRVPDIYERDMSPEARRERLRARRADPEAWWAELARLHHFDSDYSYSPAYEYDADSTTDPDYDYGGITHLEISAQGYTYPVEKRAGRIQLNSEDTLTAFLQGKGLRGDSDRSLRFPRTVIDRVNAAYRNPEGRICPYNQRVRPDLLVRAVLTADERARYLHGNVWRMDWGAPVPPLIMEVVSEGHAVRDLEFKRVLYAAAGVSEYLVYDLGGKRAAHSPRELLMFRLQADGTYRQDAPAAMYRSEILQVAVRMQPDPREALAEDADDEPPAPILQYYDPVAHRWRDAANDARRQYTAEGHAEGHAEGVAEEQLRQALLTLRVFLPQMDPAQRARVEEAWTSGGPPPDMQNRVMRVLQDPQAWETLLPPRETAPKESGEPGPRGRSDNKDW